MTVEPDGDDVVGHHPGANQRGDGALGLVEAQLEDLRPEGRQEVRRAVAGDDATAVDDGDAVAEALGLVEVVGGHEDRDPGAVPEGGDHVEEVVADAGVQPHRRLVEEEDLRVRDEGPHDLHATPLAPAVGGDRVGRDTPRAPRPGSTRPAWCGRSRRPGPTAAGAAPGSAGPSADGRRPCPGRRRCCGHGYRSGPAPRHDPPAGRGPTWAARSCSASRWSWTSPPRSARASRTPPPAPRRS